MSIEPLFSERLRPQTIDDLFLPASDLRALGQIAKSGSLPNLLFYGAPGTGKTSAARILIRSINADVYELNGSHVGGDKAVATDIEGFSSTISICGGPKLCFIDEADGLTKPVQASLRGLIEKFSKNTRFIFTVNDKSLLTAPIQSRFTSICFDPAVADFLEYADRLCRRHEEALRSLGRDFDAAYLRRIVEAGYPDFRRIANDVEFAFK